MGLDAGQWTAQILEDGLPEPVTEIEPGQVVPVARWVRGRGGAVVFLRRWRDGSWHADCAVTSIGSDGHWRPAYHWGGGPSSDPFDRYEADATGEPVAWIGGVEEKIPDEAGVVRLALGVASPKVSAIEIRRETGELVELVEVPNPYGLFALGVLDSDEYVLTPLDEGGQPFIDRRGRIHNRSLSTIV